LVDLAAARRATHLPVLRKDFVIDPYQVYESAALGADAILLIVRILDDDELSRLHALALELGLDVLVEVHDEEEALRARRLGARLVGINNRNLADFQTDPSRALRMSALFPTGTLVVAASGITGIVGIRAARASGISRCLVGEALVRASDPTTLLREWVAEGATP
jgi:indole-3-glycerol phosphate synthase